MRSLLVGASDWVGSVFRVGYLPLAPGTWASMVAACVWRILPAIPGTLYFLVLVNLFLLGVIASTIVSQETADPDPQKVVIDEWVGMWIALAGLPRTWPWIAAAFLLFRLFDIVKVFPARRLERVKGGWGIMLDDVAAGVYALIIVQGFRFLS